MNFAGRGDRVVLGSQSEHGRNVRNEGESKPAHKVTTGTKWYSVPWQHVQIEFKQLLPTITSFRTRLARTDI